MKTYQVNVHFKGNTKKTYRTYVVHADSAKKAERVAETEFANTEPDNYKKSYNGWSVKASEIQ